MGREGMDLIWRELQRLWDLEDAIQHYASHSDGIAGWHQNGDLLRWDELDDLNLYT